MDKQQKRTTTVSLVLHVLLLWFIFNSHSAHILVPSRSNGMEVSLVTMNQAVEQQTTQPVHKQATHYKIQNTQADINLNQPEKKVAPRPKPKKPTPIKKEVKKPIKPVKKPQPKKKMVNNQARQISDILNGLTPSKNQGHSRGSALGGIDHGTSDSNNLTNNYADLVIARVRPYVIIPSGIDPNSSAIVEVVLLPNLHVYQVKLIKSSGNNAYDENVQDAINKVEIFPPLPDGAKFDDYRTIRLTFHPE